MRDLLGKVHAARAMPGKAKRAGLKRVALAPALERFDFLRVPAAIAFLKLRFRIKQIHLAWSAGLDQENHRLRPRREMRSPRKYG